MSDVLIIKRLKEKSEQTFSRVYETYKNLVFYEANIILNNAHDAEDITQEVFVEFFNNVDKLEDRVNIKLHLASLGKRRAIDLYRKKENNKAYLEENIDNYGEHNQDVLSTITLDSYLEPMEAQVVALRAMFDYQFNEIAIELQLSLGTVQAMYYKAIKKLKKHYKERK